MVLVNVVAFALAMASEALPAKTKTLEVAVAPDPEFAVKVTPAFNCGVIVEILFESPF